MSQFSSHEDYFGTSAEKLSVWGRSTDQAALVFPKPGHSESAEVQGATTTITERRERGPAVDHSVFRPLRTLSLGVIRHRTLR